MDPDIPDCPEGDTGWVEGDCAQVVDYGPSMDTGMPPGFVALVILALLAGLAFTAWKVSTARRMAASSGMDVGDATSMALLTDGGFEATYLASNLRDQQAPADARPPEERLRKLQELRDQGLITEEEYAARRTAILEEL